MNEIKTVLINYCFCICLSSVTEILLPEKSKKTYRVIVTAVIILAVISPLVNIRFSANFGEAFNEGKAEADSKYLLHLQNEFERKIKENVKEILINLDVTEYEIYVTTEICEGKNEISLTELKIEIDNAFVGKKTELRKLLSEYKEVLVIEVKNGSG